MRLEDYFEFETAETEFGSVESIRIKGHRIQIDSVIEKHQEGQSPESIVKECYPTLTLEEVYATITYYLHNQVEVDTYLRRGREVADAYYRQYLKREPDAIVKRIRALRAQQNGESQTANG
jgi:uncharacterized protein (DUF433 family)